MKALLLLVIMLVAIPAAFLAPFTGILTFIWMALVRPHEWAYTQNSKYSLMVGVATVLGYFLFEIAQRPPRIVANILIILVWFQNMVGTYFGYNPFASEDKFIEFTKTLVIAILISSLVDNESRVRWLILTIIGSVGMLTFRAFIGVVIHFGQMKVIGPGGAFEDNNDFALLLVMSVPLMFYFAKNESGLWMKWGAYALTFITAVTAVFTYSRGGFLGLCVVMIIMALRTRYKVTGILTIVLAGALFATFAPEGMLSRYSSIQTAQTQDESAQQRLRAWAVCLKIIQDYPLTGIGNKNMVPIYGKYGDSADARVAHNSYLQCAVDNGLPCLFFFLTMIGVAFWRLNKVRRTYRKHAPDSKIINYAFGIETALAGYCVSAFFLSQYTQEVLYMIIPLAASLMYMAASEEKEAKLNEIVKKAVEKKKVSMEGMQNLPAY
jgi:putative inorganic carbon (hco3(-)) transporter